MLIFLRMLSAVLTSTTGLSMQIVSQSKASTNQVEHQREIRKVVRATLAQMNAKPPKKKSKAKKRRDRFRNVRWGW